MPPLWKVLWFILYATISVSGFQTDIVAVRTPQTEGYPFLTPRLTNTDLDTSDSDHTRQDGAASPANKMTITPPSRARSPRPQSLPGLGGDGIGFLAKRGPPPGSSIPGMAPGQEIVSPPGPVVVRSFARNLVEGLLCETGREVSEFLSWSSGSQWVTMEEYILILPRLDKYKI